MLDADVVVLRLALVSSENGVDVVQGGCFVLPCLDPITKVIDVTAECLSSTVVAIVLQPVHHGREIAIPVLNHCFT